MDRRNIARRAELVQSVVAGVVRNPYAVITRESLQSWLDIPGSVAERILGRLVSSGLVCEVSTGVWARLHRDEPMADDTTNREPKPETLDERARRVERGILNAFTVDRDTGLADGAGAPGSTAAGDNRAGMPEADGERGKRD